MTYMLLRRRLFRKEGLEERVRTSLPMWHCVQTAIAYVNTDLD